MAKKKKKRFRLGKTVGWGKKQILAFLLKRGYGPTRIVHIKKMNGESTEFRFAIRYHVGSNLQTRDAVFSIDKESTGITDVSGMFGEPGKVF